MVRTIVEVEGMMCHKCEAHVNEAIKENFEVNTVTSNFEQNETVILSEDALDHEMLQSVIEEEGYTVVQIQEE